MHAIYVLPQERAPDVPSLVHTLVIVPVVDFVQMFFILILLYVIATRKIGGLWSEGYLAPELDETRTPLVRADMTPAVMEQKSTDLITVRYHHDRDEVVGMEDGMRKMGVIPMSSVDGRYELGDDR